MLGRERSGPMSLDTSTLVSSSTPIYEWGKLVQTYEKRVSKPMVDLATDQVLNRSVAKPLRL